MNLIREIGKKLKASVIRPRHWRQLDFNNKEAWLYTR